MAPSRAAGAASAGVAGAVLLVMGHAPWPAAALGGSGVAVFALWRTVPGAWTGFGLLVAAAVAGRALGAPAAWRMPRELLVWWSALEVYGLATIAAVRAVREPVQVSRRLLGSWLASSGAIALGLALSGDADAAPIAATLVTFGIMHKLGVVPVYAWAPMLIRHPAPRIVAAGMAGLILAYAVLLRVEPLLPDPADAALTVIGLSVDTLPWALWRVVRQWRTDRRCAQTYAVVALVAVSLLWQATWIMK